MRFAEALGKTTNCSHSTGYLVDVVAPRDAVDVFSRLLSALRRVSTLPSRFQVDTAQTHSAKADPRRKQADPIFDTVIHVYEPISDQSFLINASRLLTPEEVWAAQSFVRLDPDQRCELVRPPPSPVGLVTLNDGSCR